MPLYKPTDLNQFLTSIGAKPNKKLSQNFLIDGNIIRKIVKAADIQPGDQVLEIGPGPGSLTEELLSRGAFVVAVETDRALANALNRLNPENDRLIVRVEDALKASIEELFSLFPKKQAPIKLLSNLPYHITTPLLARFVPEHMRISMIIVMVQEEMARRMCATHGSKDYSSLTLFLNFYSRPSYLFKVSRSCFHPAPKVDSAIVRMDLKKPPSDVSSETFFHFTRHVFQQRRKCLRNSLKGLYDPAIIKEALSKASISELARPEELSLEQFIQLHHLL